MKRLAVIALLLCAGVACGDGDDGPSRAARSTSPTSAEPVGEQCEAFRKIARQDDRFQGELNALMEPLMTAAAREDKAAAEAAAVAFAPKVQALLDTELPPLLAAYDDLVKAAPKLETDVRLVRDFTARLAEAMATVDRVEDFRGAIEAAIKQGGMQAAAATLRLDRISRAECDIVIAD